MIKYLAQENEIQKIYNDLGLIVPVGDLSTTKAPAIQPLPTSSTQTTVTAQFNVMSGGDITALSYKVNDGEAVSLTPAKGVVTITLEDLEYNSGPYEIELTATNATGSTVTSSTIDLQHYTNWATPDEVLDGNRYIGEDGEEHVGEYVVAEPTYVSLNIAPSTQEQTFDPASEQADGFDGVTVYGVTSSIDSNIAAENIKDGVTILGVTGNYQGSGGGPTDGGAVIYSVIIDYQEDQSNPYGGHGQMEIQFAQLPNWDTTNHTYYGILTTSGCGTSMCGTDPDGRIQWGVINILECSYYIGMRPVNWSNPNICDQLPAYCYPVDDRMSLISPANGYLLIFEDAIWNLKYKIPCTITTTITPDPNVGE